jgi:hypothetical protein
MQATELDTEDTLLLPRVDASPTESRLLHGLFDLLMMTLALFAFIITRLLRLAARLLRKHTTLLAPRELTTDAAAAAALDASLSSTLSALRSRSLSSATRELPPSTAILTDIDQHTTALDLQLHLRSFQASYEHCVHLFDLASDSATAAHLQAVIEQLLTQLMARPAVDCQDACSRARSAYKAALGAACAAAEAQGGSVPLATVLGEFKFQVSPLQLARGPYGCGGWGS